MIKRQTTILNPKSPSQKKLSIENLKKYKFKGTHFTISEIISVSKSSEIEDRNSHNNFKMSKCASNDEIG